MKEFLGKKSIATYILAGTSLITVISIIVYFLFSKNYGIFNNKVLIFLILTLIADLVVIFLNNRIGSYLQIAAVFLSTLAAGWFIADCIDTLSDIVNQVNFMGSGAPLEGIIGIIAVLYVIAIANIIGCFFEN